MREVDRLRCKAARGRTETGVDGVPRLRPTHSDSYLSSPPTPDANELRPFSTGGRGRDRLDWKRWGDTVCIRHRRRRVKWMISADCRIYSSPLIDDGTVFVGSTDGHIYVVDAADGTESRTIETQERAWSPSTVISNTLYVSAGGRSVYAVRHLSPDPTPIDPTGSDS